MDGVTKGSRVRVVLMDRATMSWGVMVVLVEGATLVVVDWVTKGLGVGVVLVDGATMGWGIVVVLVEGATLVVVDGVTKDSGIRVVLVDGAITGWGVVVVLVEELRARAVHAMVNISDSGSASSQIRAKLEVCHIRCIQFVSTMYQVA